MARASTALSSELGHFDVPDMAGWCGATRWSSTGSHDDDFRDFMFENAGALLGRGEPDFFKGTVVERPRPRCSPEGSMITATVPLPATAHIDHAACASNFHKIAPGFST